MADLGTRAQRQAPGRTTPAGGQINSYWAPLRDAIDAYRAFLRQAKVARASDSDREFHVVFRCGTVARVTDADAEFGGYSPGAYAFPSPGTIAENAPDYAETIAQIMADNARVWDAQKNAPPEIRGAVRRGYACVLKTGYPYPGPAAERRSAPARITAADGRALWTVFWTQRGPAGRVLNLALEAPGRGLQDAARRASDTAGTNCRYDYMFPEVAAVITPEGELWAYGPDGALARRDPGLRAG